MRGTDVGSMYTVMSYEGVNLGAGTGVSSIVHTDAERDGKENGTGGRCMTSFP